MLLLQRSHEIFSVVEWSSKFNFATTVGAFVLSDLSYKLSPQDHSHYLEYTIPDLESVSVVYNLCAVVILWDRVRSILYEFLHPI